MAHWALKRQFSIITGLAIIIILALATVAYIYWPRPSCLDGKKNQGELGIDCGGPCSLACTKQISPLKVLWVRLTELKPGRYDVAALVENANAEYGVKNFNYIVRLKDKEGILLTAKDGATYVNPNERFLLFAGNISAGERRATKGFIDIDQDTLLWEKLPTEKPRILIGTKKFSNTPAARLTVEVTNASLSDLQEAVFSVVLSDREKNVLAVSSTLVEEFLRGETRNLTFTWPQAMTQDPAYIDIYPRLDQAKLP